MTGRSRRAAWDGLGHHQNDAALVRRVIDEIWNAGDIDLADELFSSSYVNHGGLVPDLVKGPEGIKFAVALYRAAFPDLHIRVDSLTSSRGTVRLAWTGSAGAVEPTQALTGTSRSVVAGGQIIESWTEWDSAGSMRILGVLQPTAAET